MDKRGAFTSQQIASLVLIVGGFILVGLLLLNVFGNKDLTENEICKLSILEKATLPGVTSNLLPLQCTTRKVCITLDNSLFGTGIGGKKSECKAFAKEEDVEYVKVKLGNLKERTEALDSIEREVANAMYDCWSMTGGGKLDAFKGEGGAISLLSELTGDLSEVIKKIQPKCIICSRVALSEDLIEKDTENNESEILSKIDSTSYIARELVPRKTLTYLQTFTDESVRGYAGIDKNETGNKFNFSSLGAPQIAVIFMQIKTEGDPVEIAKQAGYLAATAITVGGLSKPGRIAIAGAVKVVGALPLAILATATVGLVQLSAYDTASENQALSLANCGNVENIDKDKARLGCSLIKLMAWDANEINNFCLGGIEGNL